MSKKKVIKKWISILIIAILVLIVTIISIVLINKYGNHGYASKDEELLVESLESFYEDKVIPKRLSTIYSVYNGDREITDLYKSLKIFVDYLPIISKKLNTSSKEDIIKFYNENKDIIKESLGIRKEEAFETFVEKTKKYDFSKMKFVYCEIDTNTYKDKINYLNMDINFKYDGQEELIPFHIEFSNSKLRDPVIIVSVLEEKI